MDDRRFDRLTSRFTTRRGVLRGGGFALAMGATAQASRLAAQDATPAATPAGFPSDPHPSENAVVPKPEFLFVQLFESGAWSPKTGEDGVFVLTLHGTAAETIYFSDRPERIVGMTPMDQFLQGLGFTPVNPPNAAIVSRRENGGDEDVLLVELFDPVYDAEARTLQYDARILADYADRGLAHLARAAGGL